MVMLMPNSQRNIAPDWTQAEDELLAKLCAAAEEVTWEEIGAIIGRSGSAASNRARFLGFPSERYTKRRAWPPERIAEAKALWDKGFSRNEIAKRMKASPQVISQLRLKHGWAQRRHGGLRQPHYEYTRALQVLKAGPMRLADILAGSKNGHSARAQIYRLLQEGKIVRVGGAKYSRVQVYQLAPSAKAQKR